MKKLLLILTSVFALCQLDAQIILERSDFTLQAGSTINTRRVSSAFYPTVGANQIWDYTTVTINDAENITFNTNDDEVNFPEADLSNNFIYEQSLGPLSVSFDRTDYYVLNDTAFGRTGVKSEAVDVSLFPVTGGPTDSILFQESYGHYASDPGYDAWFPMNYGDTRSSNYVVNNNSLVSVALLGLNHVPNLIRAIGSQTNEVVGWGSLSIVNPADLNIVTLDVLLMKTTTVQVDSFYLAGQPTPRLFLALLGLTQGEENTYVDYKFFAKSYDYPVLQIGGGSFTLADLGFLVYLKDSNGDPLAGGSLEFQDGGWQTATEISRGVFHVNTTKANINLKMTYAQASVYETVSTSSPYTFQTELVTFELRKRTGELGYNWGEVTFASNGEPIGFTGENGLGLLQQELLPREYTFRMKFRGGRGDITQDISVNPIVTWEMARMLVQVNKSDGTRGLNGVDIKYKGYNQEQFGITGTSENGRARRDLLPGFYKFTLKYLGASMVVDDFEVVAGDNELIIDGVATTVELLESGTGLPVDGAKVKNIGVTSNLMGYTGDSGSGIVTADLLPVVYGFEVTYNGNKNTQYGIDISSTPWITFYTDDLKSGLVKDSGIELAVYPNPFSGKTTLAFDLEHSDEITVAVYDISGKLVEILFDGRMAEGTHKLNWTSNQVQRGVYIVRLNTSTTISHKNIVKM